MWNKLLILVVEREKVQFYRITHAVMFKISADSCTEYIDDKYIIVNN
jgi:hypothetical protein